MCAWGRWAAQTRSGGIWLNLSQDCRTLPRWQVTDYLPPSLPPPSHSSIRPNGGYVNLVAHYPLYTSAERSATAKTKTTWAAKDLFIGVLSVRQTTCVSLAIITTQGSCCAQWHNGSITGADKCVYLHCTLKEPNTDHTSNPRETTCTFSLCLSFKTHYVLVKQSYGESLQTLTHIHMQ